MGVIGIAKSSKRHTLYCSFCGKRDEDVAYLVAGPSVFICNECVELCRDIGHQILTVPGPANENQDSNIPA